MTSLPGVRAFKKALPIATLVLVDMCRSNLPLGIKRSPAGTVLQNCRRALAAARQYGWRVAHVRSCDANGILLRDPSIAGFEPERHDAKFERRRPSCYSSPYFQNVIEETAGAFVLAGFLGDGSALATIADALLVGDHVTLLSDAALDETSRRVFTDQLLGAVAAHTSLNFSVVPTSAWLRTVAFFNPPAPELSAIAKHQAARKRGRKAGNDARL